ncbi:MAG: hypothetical protein ABI443_08875 [Chthoniobacterales bacterium]
MDPIFECKAYTLFADPLGFFELVVETHHELDLEDFPDFDAFLEDCGVKSLKLLINRKNEYSTGASLLTPPYPKFRERMAKTAYLVYHKHTTELIAQFTGDIALRELPHKVFHEREAAIAWLLEDLPPKS